VVYFGTAVSDAASGGGGGGGDGNGAASCKVLERLATDTLNFVGLNPDPGGGPPTQPEEVGGFLLGRPLGYCGGCALRSAAALRPPRCYMLYALVSTRRTPGPRDPVELCRMSSQRPLLWRRRWRS
jgi:hypothetical protein